MDCVGGVVLVSASRSRLCISRTSFLLVACDDKTALMSGEQTAAQIAAWLSIVCPCNTLQSAKLWDRH